MPARRGIPDYANRPRIPHLGRKSEDSIGTNERTSLRMLLCSACQVFALRLRGVIGGMRDETGSIREALRRDPAKRACQAGSQRSDADAGRAHRGQQRNCRGATAQDRGHTGRFDSAPGLRTGQERMQAGESAMAMMLHEPA
ncbi:glutathione S-transferase C terminus [Rhodovulum sulfidophilum]|uniref:Glutathione S-transferase C terminus n=1 Tax=Rhodovulum sulfidophilum TaxID=35806 RepID=A0A0D6AXS6_RHOSU|nr:glutathione S-transferase C terminus [Rhodovulum sulfidophilum]